MSGRARARRGSGNTSKSPTGQAGQALLELALVAPILILLLVSVVQLGVIFQRQIGLENAVREAARRGASLDTTSINAGLNAAWTLGELQTILANVQGHAVAQERDLQVCFYTPTSPDDTDPIGNKRVVVKVDAGYAHPLFMPIVGQILDGFDGANDSALRGDSSSEFEVAQVDPTDPLHDLGGTQYCDTP